MKLTDEQQKIVNDTERCLLVTAPAGSGKTEVMARRAQMALDRGKKNVLCLTFTNRAANSMKKRFEMLKTKTNISVYTFHAFCNFVLRSECDSLGLLYNYTILDEQDTSEIIESILKKFSKRVSPHDIKAASTHLDDYRFSVLVENVLHQDIINSFNNRFKVDFNLFYNEYEKRLTDSNCLDFNSLVTIVYDFFKNNPNSSSWKNLYDFIQVDEMQDTSIVEYEIIEMLALENKNFSLFGDVNQTIYEWRDSRPHEIVRRFKENFKVQEYNLVENFRSTKNINDCASEFLKNYYINNNVKSSESFDSTVSENEDGDKVHLCFLQDKVMESKQICRIIKKMNELYELDEIAVLTRTNNDARFFSNAINQNNIPTYLVDEYNFFRREEIKDVLSLLKLCKNTNDISCAKRVLLKYAKNIGTTTIDSILSNNCCASLSDFITSSHKSDADILDNLIQKYINNQMVVFDVESTGLDVYNDEIIEIAGVKFGIDGITSEFYKLITPTKSVGSSSAVHGYTDEYLKKNGENAKDALSEFLNFCNGSILAGHNVTYDISILKSQLSRLEIEHKIDELFFDTLTASKRVIKGVYNYKLGTLIDYIGVNSIPTHHAMDDVKATCELAHYCFEKFNETAEKRIEFYSKYKSKFSNFSTNFEKLLFSFNDARPLDRLEKAYDFLNIFDKYKDSKQKLNNLGELKEIFKSLDDKAIDAMQSHSNILNTLTLSNSSERALSSQNKVSVFTVHQSKGLQFRAVIIANVVEGSFPSSLNIKYDNIDEEARLFYVAMTRASSNLFITLSKEGDYDKYNVSSRFIKLLPKQHYIIHSNL